MLKRMMFVLGCVFWALSFSQLSGAQEPPSSELTTSISTKWLSMLDQGQYEDSWETASSYFKTILNKDQWVARASAIKNSFGDMVSRTFKFNKYSTFSQGSPIGENVTTYFSTVFKNKTSSLETVILMKDKDGQWRVAAYMVQ